VGDDSAAGLWAIPASTHDIQSRYELTEEYKPGITHSSIKPQDNNYSKISQQDSHQNLAEPRIDAKDPVDAATVDKLFDAL